MGRNKNLENVVPIDVNVSIDGLKVVVGSGIDNKPIIGMDISSFIRRMVS